MKGREESFLLQIARRCSILAVIPKFTDLFTTTKTPFAEVAKSDYDNGFQMSW
jgi:hypothetical protein